MSRFGDYAVSASADKKVRVWDVSTAKEFRVLEGHSDTVTSCAISEDSRSILTGSLDKTCRLWNTLGRQLFQINVDFSVVSLKMSPDQPAAFVATKATIEVCSNIPILAKIRIILRYILISSFSALI